MMNSYLDRQIRFYFGKSFDEMTEEEKTQITEITLPYKDFNGNLIKNKGYGHGVGLSQWGSKFLAEEGKNYKDILRYYYTGVTIGKCDF